MELILELLAALLVGLIVGWLAARQSVARLRSELDKETALHHERLKTYEDAEARLRDSFRALSADALSTNNRAFLDLAETRLREARAEAANDLESRRISIETLLAPMAKTLGEVEREIRESEKQRIQSGTELIQRVAALDSAEQGLRAETARLVDALKRPGVRGRWGELQLRRVFELAGMLEHCDFEEQHTLSTDERRMRPDVIVHLPGGRRIVVDSKVPLEAYLRALDETDVAAKRKHLADHARQLRGHIAQLASKEYAAHVQPSPDFVAMFLPGEAFFSAAVEHDPSLIEYGAEQHVVLASPTTLIALLRAVAFGWQQESIAREASQIAELGRKLYDAVSTLADHFARVGSRLGGAVEAYNDAVGSLERNVLVKARRFKELKAANGGDVAEISTIEHAPRRLQAPELIDGVALMSADVSGGEAEPV
jgi:DNA recombination protein RmuC